MAKSKEVSKKDIKFKIHEIIFEADTPLGKFFDIALFLFIVTSVLTVILESVPSYAARYGNLFTILEWIFTIFFSIEYALRFYSTLKPIKYVTSFFGIIDLLSILPSYLSFFFVGAQSFLILRSLRLLRIFRVFKMVSFVKDSEAITNALRHSRRKIVVFLFAILLIVTMVGALMYLIEGGINDGFDSIPRGIYWAIVTLTTVGYGDISPITHFGQFVSSIVMILGYAVIAVPTGIVTSEMSKSRKTRTNTQSCRNCSKEGHDDDAIYCKFCGSDIHN